MNKDLAHYLRDHQHTTNHSVPTQPLYPLPSYRLRVRHRLSSDDIAELIRAFKAGTPKWQLAERYGIGLKSVQKLLREHGVKRRSRYDIQP